jgi:hypothetical protein
MKLRVNDEAQANYDYIDGWWRDNRDKNPERLARSETCTSVATPALPADDDASGRPYATTLVRHLALGARTPW